MNDIYESVKQFHNGEEIKEFSYENKLRFYTFGLARPIEVINNTLKITDTDTVLGTITSRNKNKDIEIFKTDKLIYINTTTKTIIIILDDNIEEIVRFIKFLNIRFEDQAIEIQADIKRKRKAEDIKEEVERVNRYLIGKFSYQDFKDHILSSPIIIRDDRDFLVKHNPSICVFQTLYNARGKVKLKHTDILKKDTDSFGEQYELSINNHCISYVRDNKQIIIIYDDFNKTDYEKEKIKMSKNNNFELVNQECLNKIRAMKEHIKAARKDDWL